MARRLPVGLYLGSLTHNFLHASCLLWGGFSVCHGAGNLLETGLLKPLSRKRFQRVQCDGKRYGHYEKNWGLKMLEVYASCLISDVGCAGAFNVQDRSPIHHFTKTSRSGCVANYSTDNISSRVSLYSILTLLN